MNKYNTLVELLETTLTNSDIPYEKKVVSERRTEFIPTDFQFVKFVVSRSNNKWHRQTHIRTIYCYDGHQLTYSCISIDSNGSRFKRKYQHAAKFGAYNTQETYRETDKSKFWLINLYQSMNKILSP